MYRSSTLLRARCRHDPFENHALGEQAMNTSVSSPEDGTESVAATLSRRSVVKVAAWSAPVVAFAIGAPAHAASGDTSFAITNFVVTSAAARTFSAQLNVTAGTDALTQLMVVISLDGLGDIYSDGVSVPVDDWRLAKLSPGVQLSSLTFFYNNSTLSAGTCTRVLEFTLSPRTPLTSGDYSISAVATAQSPSGTVTASQAAAFSLALPSLEITTFTISAVNNASDTGSILSVQYKVKNTSPAGVAPLQGIYATTAGSQSWFWSGSQNLTGTDWLDPLFAYKITTISYTGTLAVGEETSLLSVDLLSNLVLSGDYALTFTAFTQLSSIDGFPATAYFSA
jgi:hypothetical protein